MRLSRVVAVARIHRPALARRARLRPARSLATPGALLRGREASAKAWLEVDLDGLPARARVRADRRVRGCFFGPWLSERDGARPRLVRRAARDARARKVVVRPVPPRRQDELGSLWTAQHAPHGPAQPPAKVRKPARPIPRYRSPVIHEPYPISRAVLRSAYSGLGATASTHAALFHTQGLRRRPQRRPAVLAPRSRHPRSHTGF